MRTTVHAWIIGTVSSCILFNISEYIRSTYYAFFVDNQRFLQRKLQQETRNKLLKVPQYHKHLRPLGHYRICFCIGWNDWGAQRRVLVQ